MTDKFIIKETSKKFGIPQVRIKEVMDAIEVVLKDYLPTHNNSVKVMDLRMNHEMVEARQGRNPKTNEPMTIPAHHTMKVKMSADWKRLFKDITEREQKGEKVVFEVDEEEITE